MATTTPIKVKGKVKEMIGFYLKKKNFRDAALLTVGFTTGLRISDSLSLTWNDVYDFKQNKIHTYINITEGKTKKHKVIYINKQAANLLMTYFTKLKGVTPDMYLFKSRKGTNRAITRVQAYRLITEAAKAVNVAGVIGCHSLRKTFGYFANLTGASPAILMELFNHSSFKVTRIYLGIGQEELDNVYKQMIFM